MPVPTSDHVFLYSPDAIIQVESVKDLADDIKDNKVTVIAPMGKVPKNADFFITVNLPLVSPLNLVPLPKPMEQPVKSGLLVQVAVFDATNFAAVKAATPMSVGLPLNNPQRRSKRENKRELRHQTFRFGGLSFTGTKAVFVFHTVHRFFDDNGRADQVAFSDARTIIKDVVKDVA